MVDPSLKVIFSLASRGVALVDDETAAAAAADCVGVLGDNSAMKMAGGGLTSVQWEWYLSNGHDSPNIVDRKLNVITTNSSYSDHK